MEKKPKKLTMHYLPYSPSGCTFWGKKPWSRKKKILWQLGTLVGAPVGIGLVAGIAVPAMIIGIPVWVGRKLYEQNKDCTNKFKRNAFIAGGVTASVSRYFFFHYRPKIYHNIIMNIELKIAFYLTHFRRKRHSRYIGLRELITNAVGFKKNSERHIFKV